jgi:hypothetical protein
MKEKLWDYLRPADQECMILLQKALGVQLVPEEKKEESKSSFLDALSPKHE